MVITVSVITNSINEKPWATCRRCFWQENDKQKQETRLYLSSMLLLSRPTTPPTGNLKMI
jgi:hypothetical protein